MPTAPEIRHIVWDIGSVLIHYDPHLPFRRLIPDDEERAWFFANVCTQQWNIEQDRGRSWDEAEALLIAQHPERADHIRAFRAYWHEMVPHAYEHSVSHLERQIAEGRDVTLLTNFASDTLELAMQRYAFLTWPRGKTVSAEVRLLKPDPAIYDHHTRTFGLDKAATLFIDDSAANARSAADFGWNVIHYRGPQSLDDGLAHYGLL